jgi:hypothetical protein
MMKENEKLLYWSIGFLYANNFYYIIIIIINVNIVFITKLISSYTFRPV